MELVIETSFVKVMQELGDAERGRLFTAMCEYAETGETQEFRGNERYVFPAAKMMIDKQLQNTCAEKEKERTKEKERERSLNTHKKIFIPPTLDEVRERVRERNYKLDPVAFYNYYVANGWMVGRNKMRDWHAALAGWESREGQYSNSKKKPNAALQYSQTPINADDFDALVVDLGKEQSDV